MAQEPDLLLLDEPFANLDIDARREALRLLDGWREDRAVTVVMVSHDISKVPRSCDRIVVIDKGRIVMDGPRNEVLSSEDLARLFGAWGDDDE